MFLLMLPILSLLHFGCAPHTSTIVSRANQVKELAVRLEGMYESATLTEMAQVISSSLPQELGTELLKLAYRKTHKPVDYKGWLIGRLYLLASSFYLIGALDELRYGDMDKASKLCYSSLTCLKSSSRWLPKWERTSAIGYAEQLNAVLKRLKDDRHYALVHLQALQFKVEAHAVYVPPEPRR